jgi:hypothetical protein
MNNKEKFKKYSALSEKFGNEAAENITEIIDLSMFDFKTYVDRRFEHLNQKFESIDQKFIHMEKSFNSVKWGMGLAVAFIAAFIAVMKFI